MILRRAEARDAGGMWEIVQRSYAGYLPRMDRPPAPMLLTEQDLARSRAWVAELDGELAGLLTLLLHPDHVRIDVVAVDPVAQGRGVGSRLLDLAEEVAREHGVPEVRLYTNEVMTENLRLYPARGYTETHRAEDEGYRRVFFVKAVGPRTA